MTRDIKHRPFVCRDKVRDKEGRVEVILEELVSQFREKGWPMIANDQHHVAARYSVLGPKGTRNAVWVVWINTDIVGDTTLRQSVDNSEILRPNFVNAISIVESCEGFLLQ